MSLVYDHSLTFKIGGSKVKIALSQLMIIPDIIFVTVPMFHITGNGCHKKIILMTIKVLPMFYARLQMSDISEYDLVITPST